jgi:hypothetical protein
VTTIAAACGASSSVIRAPLLVCEMRSGLIAASDTEYAWLDMLTPGTTTGAGRAAPEQYTAAGVLREQEQPERSVVGRYLQAAVAGGRFFGVAGRDPRLQRPAQVDQADRIGFKAAGPVSIASGSPAQTS